MNLSLFADHDIITIGSRLTGNGLTSCKVPGFCMVEHQLVSNSVLMYHMSLVMECLSGCYLKLMYVFIMYHIVVQLWRQAEILANLQINCYSQYFTYVPTLS